MYGDQSFLGQLLHQWSLWWSSLAISPFIHCISGLCPAIQRLLSVQQWLILQYCFQDISRRQDGPWIGSMGLPMEARVGFSYFWVRISRIRMTPLITVTTLKRSGLLLLIPRWSELRRSRCKWVTQSVLFPGKEMTFDKIIRLWKSLLSHQTLFTGRFLQQSN